MKKPYISDYNLFRFLSHHVADYSFSNKSLLNFFTEARAVASSQEEKRLITRYLAACIFCGEIDFPDVTQKTFVEDGYLLIEDKWTAVGFLKSHRKPLTALRGLVQHNNFHQDRYRKFLAEREIEKKKQKQAECTLPEVVKPHPSADKADVLVYSSIRVGEVEKVSLRSGGRRFFLHTLNHGTFTIDYRTSTAKGIESYDIISFESVKGSTVISRKTMKSRNGGDAVGARSISVTFDGEVVDFLSVVDAYNTIEPELAYSTVCRNTKNLTDQEKIDNEFYRSATYNRDTTLRTKHVR